MVIRKVTRAATQNLLGTEGEWLLATHTDAVPTHTREEPCLAPRKRGACSVCVSNSGQVTAFLQAEGLLWISRQVAGALAFRQQASGFRSAA